MKNSAKFNHPSEYELMQALRFDFYSLDLPKIYEKTKKYQVKVIKIVSNGDFYFQDKFYESNKINKFISSSSDDILALVTFDKNLKFKDYISFLQNINVT